MSICADFLVELRGFERLTSAVQGHTRGLDDGAASVPERPYILVPKALAGSSLDRSCFPCPTSAQRLKGFPGLDQNRWIA